MRSNKKGYTLIEIVVCILLITLIGTISVIVVKNDEKTTDELKAEYVEKIKEFIDSNSKIFINLEKIIKNKDYDCEERDFILDDIKIEDLILTIDLNTLDIKSGGEYAR